MSKNNKCRNTKYPKIAETDGQILTVSFKRFTQRIALHVTLDENHKYVGRCFQPLSYGPLNRSGADKKNVLGLRV